MIGRTIAQYRIDAELGRGGMGLVYRAFDTKLRREVAFKVLREEVVGQSELRDRVLNEARAASPLNHPNIATIYEVGEEEDLLFIVMELVAGTTLQERIKEKPFRPRTLARLGTQIAEALEVAHSHAVVHGDVKPENIVIQQHGRIKLLDFGVARQVMTPEAVTATLAGTAMPRLSDDRIAGTLAYMAPEKLRGSSAEPRSDLFSLGVLLYEMAAGHRPFPGPDAASLMSQILDQPAPRLDSGGVALPSELARIVHKLLEKDVEARYQSAREVKTDLTNLERALELGPTLSATVADRRAVAVLPFKLLTPNPDDEYLELALADAVINGLSTSDQLLLRPSSAVISYRRGPVDPLVAARELNVQVIVEGSIQRLGTQLRAHVQVWNADDGTTLLSAKHEGAIANLFELQDEIAESLSAALGVAVQAQEAPPTQNPRAYELFLRAVERLSFGNRWDTRTAVEMLRQATSLDPEFVDAWARLGQACFMMAFAFEPETSWYEAAEEAIERALALDPANVDAHVGRGRVLWSPEKRFQNRPALRALGEALRLGPGSHEALLWQSLVFLHVGLLEEARAGLTDALAMKPDDPFTLNFLGQTLEFQGDYEEAEEYQARALAIDPTQIWANLFQPSVLIHQGELDRAQQSIRTAEQLLGSDSMLGSLEALVWARRGESSKAEAILKRALTDTKTKAHIHHAWHNAGCVYALLGKPNEAVEWLAKATEMGLPNYPLYRDDPHLEPLRGDLGYQRLLADLKREWEDYRREFGRR